MPLVPFADFVGSAFKAESVNVATAELVNWYLAESDDPTFPKYLAPTPGTAIFCDGLQGPIRGMFSQDGRAFCVAGTKVYEVQGDGTADQLGAVVSDGNPCSLASNGHGGHQLLILSSGNGYIFDLVSSTFQLIAASGFPSNALMCDYIDGYFLVLQATTSKFFVSALQNGLSWSPADVGQINSSSDTTLAMKVLARNAWMMGSLRSEIWVDQGGTFPLAPIQPLLEFGIGAPWSLQVCAGTLCFVGASIDGGAVVLQSAGYGFRKISTTDIDRRLSALPDLANVRAFSYEERGHVFYVVCPNTGPADVYDFTTGGWHQRGVWNDGSDQYDPPDQWCHMYAFGRHLVGDRTTGTLYEQSTLIGDDHGTPIRRLRTAPHLNQSQQWLFGSQVSIGADTGLAPLPVYGSAQALSYVGAVLSASPSLYLPLNTRRGTVATAYPSGQVDGVIHGAPELGVPSAVGSTAIALSALTQYVGVSPVPATGTTFTLAAWVYLRGSGSQTTYATILGNSIGTVFVLNRPDAPSPSTQALIMIFPDGVPANGFVFGGNGAGQVVPVESWHFVAITSNGATFTFYLDGVTTGASTGMGAQTPLSFSPVIIGQASGGGHLFEGALSDVMTWSNRALAADEILSLYQAGTPRLVEQTLDLSYSTDGGHVYTAPDPSGLGDVGDYGKLVTWYRTPGRFHDLVLRATTSATSAPRLNSCQVRLDQGTGMR